MKKTLSIILLISMLLLLLCGCTGQKADADPTPAPTPAPTDDNSDTGDPNGGQVDPVVHTVSTAEELMALVTELNKTAKPNATIVLGADIDLTGKTWVPFGATDAKPFSGTIDGAGHAITGLSASKNKKAFGLIGYGAGDVTVKDLTLTVAFTEMEEYVGGVMGLYNDLKNTTAAEHKVTFENITVNGTLSAKEKVAGILGCNYVTNDVNASKNKNVLFTFKNCVNNAAITADQRSGGIAGAVYAEFPGDGKNNEVRFVFDNCKNQGNISESSHFSYVNGGIAGFLCAGGNYEFKNCSNTGKADADLFGCMNTSPNGAYQATAAADADNCGRTGFGFLDFTPVQLTAYDCYLGSLTAYTVNWKFQKEDGTLDHRYGRYGVGTTLADDEWRLVIDGTAYRAPYLTRINGAEDCTQDTAHAQNYAPEGHWTNDKYTLDTAQSSANELTYIKNSVGECN